MTTLVDDDLVERWQTDGYVVLPDLLTTSELDHFQPLVEAAVRERTSTDARPLEEKSRYEQSFLQCMNLWEDHPEVRPLTFHPRIGQAAAELLGVEAVRLWHDQALFKEPGGRATDAHQDQPYWPIAEPDTITAWIPFEGSTLASGALGYVPGSHRSGLAKFVNIFFGQPDDILAEPEIAGVEPVFVEVPRGGVAFHNGYTVHLSKPNTTDRMRSVHTMIMFADGCTRGTPAPHFSVDRAAIEVGAPIRSEATPMLWPRAPDDPWPEPPPLPQELTGHGSRGSFPAT